MLWTFVIVRAVGEKSIQRRMFHLPLCSLSASFTGWISLVIEKTIFRTL